MYPVTATKKNLSGGSGCFNYFALVLFSLFLLALVPYWQKLGVKVGI
jgi:hypothetical protein